MEWQIIETVIFLGLNFSFILNLIRRNFISITRDYSHDFSKDQMYLLKRILVESIYANIS